MPRSPATLSKLPAVVGLPVASPEPLEALCHAAAALFRVPVALVALIDEAGLRIVAASGLEAESIDPSITALCERVIQELTLNAQANAPFVVPDLAADSRLAPWHAAVPAGTKPARFAAAAPLSLPDVASLGALLLLDWRPRHAIPNGRSGRFLALAGLVAAQLQIDAARSGRERERGERTRLQSRLAERESAFRSVTDAQRFAEAAAGFGQWRIRPDEWSIVWSEGVARVFGRPMPETGAFDLDHHMTFYHPEDRASVRGRIVRAINEWSPNAGGYLGRARVLRPDGEIRHVIIQGMPESRDGEEIDSIYGVIIDVSDLVATEIQAHETSAVLRATLETMDQGLISYGPDMRVRIHNRRANEIVGFPPSVLFEGAHLADLHRFLTARGEYSLADDHVGPILEAGDMGVGPNVYERSRPDGSTIEVRRSPVSDGGFVYTFADVTRRRAIERAVQESEQRFRLLAENTSDVIIWSDLDTTRRYVSPAAASVLGYSAEELVGTRPLAFVHPDDVSAYGKLLSELTCGRIEKAVTAQRYRHRDGTWIWIEVSFSLTKDPQTGSANGYVASLRDITRRKEAELKIAHMAVHDALTGLPNRVLFMDRLQRVASAADSSLVTFAVLACDLDRFKAVNDTLGHHAGDALLRVVAERLAGAVRDGDTVARLGGDEFAILLAKLDGPQNAARTAQRIIEAMRDPVELGPASPSDDEHASGFRAASVGISIGIAIGPRRGVDADTLFRNADIALYDAKASGRSTWSFYEPGMDAALAARTALELDMYEAVRAGGFTLHYQPIVSLTSRRVEGFEALMRWPHPQRGLVPPSDFVPLAEETGLIVPLGAWALHEACREAATWPGEAKVAVNISAVQFTRPGLEQNVVAALAASGLAPRRLELEITESVMMTDSESIIGALHRLSALGVRIALDDFGTGYSSLSYLRRFPFDKIKIDRSFVVAIDDPETAAIVRAIVGLAARRGAGVTAEGVETDAQFEAVAREGCTHVQGYLTGRPMPSAEIAPFLHSKGRQAA